MCPCVRFLPVLLALVLFSVLAPDAAVLGGPTTGYLGGVEVYSSGSFEKVEKRARAGQEYKPENKSGKSGNWFDTLGAVVRATPSIKVRTVYDSNVDNKGFDDIKVETRPGLKARFSTERLKLLAHGDFVWKEFLNHDELDRADWYSGLDADWAVFEKLNLGLQVEQAHDHTVDWAMESFASDVEAVTRNSVTATPSAVWQITELDGMAFSYSFRQDDYDRADKYDFNDNTLNISWFRKLGERTNFNLGLMGRYTRYFTELSDSDYQANGFVVAGFDHELFEGVKIMFSAGGGMTYSDYTVTQLQPDFTVGTERGTELNTAYILEAKLEWKDDRLSIIPSFSRTLQPSFYGEDMTVDQFKLYLRYRLTERLEMFGIGTFTIADTAGHIKKRHNEGYFLQMIFRYLILKDLRLEFGTNFNHNWNRAKEDSFTRSKTNERFRGWLGVSYDFPLQIMP